MGSYATVGAGGLLCGLILLVGASAAADPVVCDYHPVDPGSGRSRQGGFRLDLGPADDPRKPEAWLGPVTLIQPSGASCTAGLDAGMIERPLYADGQNLVLTRYSTETGLRAVFILNIPACRVLWKSPDFSGAVEMKPTTLRTGPTLWKLGARCVPENQIS